MAPQAKERPNISGLGGSKSSAFRVSASGDVLDQSTTADALVTLWNADEGALHEVVHEALTSGLPTDARIEDGAGATYWIVAVPQGEECVVVTRDTTLPDKVTEALLRSRTMLKELLDASVDVAFELDPEGVFRFVSPHTAFGAQTEAWLGHSATQIFWPNGDAPVRNPFAARTKSQFDNVPVVFSGTEKRWLHFNVHPIVGPGGDLLGLRGTCRDMTKRFMAARKTKQDGLRFMLLQRITGLLNTIESADDLLDSASSTLQEVLRADMVWAAVHYEQGLVPSSIVGTYREIVDLEGIWTRLKKADASVIEVAGAGRQHLALMMRRGERDLGMMVVSRDTEVSPWSDQEIELLSGVVDVLTAAFGKAELIETLYRLSSNDELTGLMNRRALTDTIERRLKHQSRTGLSGCFVFIDLDFFKEVNDTLGHKAGDDALKMVAAKMQAMIRPCDYAGRYGGDEFVVWLEDMQADVAAEKIRALLDEMPNIREEIGAADLRLCASVGICQSLPGKDLSFAELADIADSTLYEVKQAGKGDIAITKRDEDASEGAVKEDAEYVG
ncbi:MAG: diguanylate cyclase [Alphaproteobacteria bacterium]|nr:diguanylate cyclase [Alphaproteobacteria bacterium]